MSNTVRIINTGTDNIPVCYSDGHMGWLKPGEHIDTFLRAITLPTGTRVPDSVQGNYGMVMDTIEVGTKGVPIG